jgi:hypothetical protein
MNPFDDRLWNPQSDVLTLAGVSSCEHKNPWLVFKKITNFVGAQVPHLGNLSNRIMPFIEGPGLHLE